MLVKRQTKLAVFMIVQLLSASCMQRSIVKPSAAPQSVAPSSQAPSPSLGDYMQAVYKISQGSSPEVEQQRRKLLDAHPDLAQLAARIQTDATAVEARKTLAAAYLDAGLLWDAYNLYDEILKIQPTDFETEIGLAKVWDKWGDYNLARQHARTAISMNPRSPEAHDLMGKVALHHNDPNEAVGSFQLALQLSPDDAVITANLGYAYMLAGNLPQAKVNFQKALSLDPTLVEARNNLGIVLAQTGDYAGAFAQMELASKPEVALNNLGALLLSQRKGVEAAEVLKQALQVNPNYDKAKENLKTAQSLIPLPVVVDLPSFDSASTGKKPSPIVTKTPDAVLPPDAAAESARRLAETVVHVDAGVFEGQIDPKGLRMLGQDAGIITLPPIEPPTEAPRFATELQRTFGYDTQTLGIQNPAATPEFLRPSQPDVAPLAQPRTEAPRFASELQKVPDVHAAASVAEQPVRSSLLLNSEPVIVPLAQPRVEVPPFASELQKTPRIQDAASVEERPVQSSLLLRNSEPEVTPLAQPRTEAPAFAMRLQEPLRLENIPAVDHTASLLSSSAPTAIASVQPSVEAPHAIVELQDHASQTLKSVATNASTTTTASEPTTLAEQTKPLEVKETIAVQPPPTRKKASKSAAVHVKTETGRNIPSSPVTAATQNVATDNANSANDVQAQHPVTVRPTWNWLPTLLYGILAFLAIALVVLRRGRKTSVPAATIPSEKIRNVRAS